MKRPPLFRSFRHAFDGLWHTLRTQRNMQIHLCVAAGVTAAGIWLRLDRVQWSVLAITMGAVLVGETINTAVEAIVDLLAPQFHDRAKVAKDVSAAAVLLLSITAIIVGVLILGPPLWDRAFGLR
jgi:diacylglycerol kinase